MIYATKKKNESNERLMSRFKKLIQRSRIVVKAKKSRFRAPPITKREERIAAIICQKHRTRRAMEQYYN